MGADAGDGWVLNKIWKCMCLVLRCLESSNDVLHLGVCEASLDTVPVEKAEGCGRHGSRGNPDLLDSFFTWAAPCKGHLE